MCEECGLIKNKDSKCCKKNSLKCLTYKSFQERQGVVKEVRKKGVFPKLKGKNSKLKKAINKIKNKRDSDLEDVLAICFFDFYNELRQYEVVLHSSSLCKNEGDYISCFICHEGYIDINLVNIDTKVIEKVPDDYKAEITLKANSMLLDYIFD